MSSGSLKDLLKAITASSTNVTLPLPADLLQVISAYNEKHSPQDETESQRLQEELLNVYETSFLDHPARLAPFLRILRELRPVLKGSGRSLQWWDKLSTPVMTHLGVEKGLAFEARDALLKALVYDEEEEASRLQDAQVTSDAVAESLILMWLDKTEAAADTFDGHASFVVKQLQLILNSYGKKKPKEFLQLINKFFVRKSSRIPALALLCDFFRQQPPHLHQLLQTPLFENLLQCLQIDTSTRVISLAITALVMFLPHIPNSASNHLPALFNIYSRLLFWDRERNAADILPRTEKDTEDDNSISEKQPAEVGKSWDKLAYLLESEDDSVPELLYYFTFLYGLYPINFMSYIRKPQRYLRHANFPGADDLNIEPAEIRERSELFRQVHLLHPNFFMLTLESELSDKNRWAKTEAADVVADCMALYVVSEESLQNQQLSRAPSKKIDPNLDVPDHSLLDSEAATPYQSRHNSWRNTQSTAVASPEVYRTSGLHRKLSQTSQSMPSMGDSPLLHPIDRLDSPTLPPQTLGSPPNNRISDIFSSQRSTRGSIYQTLTNESVGSLALSNNHQEINVDAYLESLSRDHAPRSPSLRPATTDAAPSLKIAYLQREIQLLKNDLNFERYLKQQHASHIGQLRRKLIREARVEAETQNLVNSNRTLRAKLEESTRVNVQIKTETEKSKAHSRKWEGDLIAKLRVLRAEQKEWTKENEELKRDLNIATDNVAILKNIIVETEAKELRAQQKVATVQSSLDELERLRVEVADLTRQVIKYEAGELAAYKALESEKAALHRVKILEMELCARDMEVAKTKDAFAAQLDAIQLNASRYRNGHKDGKFQALLTKEVVAESVAALRDRHAELQEENRVLRNKNITLELSYSDALEQNAQYRKQLNVDALLSSSGGITSFGPSGRQRSPTLSSDAHSSDAGLSLPSLNSLASLDSIGSGSSTAPLMPKPRPKPKVDTNFRPISEEATPTGPVAPIHYFQAPQPYQYDPATISSYDPPGSSGTYGTSPTTPVADSGSQGSGGNRKASKVVEPNSELRVYGRGGPQNIGKKAKDPLEKKNKESDKGKEKVAKDTQPAAQEPKKEKRSLGLRGIRGFV